VAARATAELGAATTLKLVEDTGMVDAREVVDRISVDLTPAGTASRGVDSGDCCYAVDPAP
jgi:hypothetical protein